MIERQVIRDEGMRAALSRKRPPSETALLFFLARLDMTAALTFIDLCIVGRRHAFRASRPAWIFGHAAQNTDRLVVPVFTRWIVSYAL